MNRLLGLAEALGRFSQKWIPSAFSIAALLTGLTAVAAVALTGAGPAQVWRAWGGGFWELLGFSMQMVLVMFLGSVLAKTQLVSKLLDVTAGIPKTPRAAVATLALASMALSYVNWGLSIIGSALLVKAVAKRVPQTDYRLLVACAYFGLGATWHAGLSASAPLAVATPGHFLEKEWGLVPLTQTLFSPFNLGLLLLSVAVLTGLAWAMHPAPAQTVRVTLVEEDAKTGPADAEFRPGFAAWIDRGPGLNWVFGGLLLAYWASSAWAGGWASLNINSVNLGFLAAAIFLHRSPRALLQAAEEAASSLSGVVLQFPLYAGMYGMFKNTGLTELLGAWFVSWSNAQTFPAVVYLYSGFVNYFVPSGGAKWAIEGPYLLEAAKALQVSPAKVVMAYAWGDMATDLIQPFWALPLLGIAKLEFKDILGFLLLAFFLYVPLVTAAFLFWGWAG